MEITNCLNLGRAMRRNLRMTLLSVSGSPSTTSWFTTPASRMVKSSTPSPLQNLSTSYSRRTFCALTFQMRSLPIRIVLMLSHASIAVSFVASAVMISIRTALQIASSAMRST
jgi:hypothetical protein